MSSTYTKKYAEKNTALNQTSTVTNTIEDIDIVDYLKSHPDFFRRNPAALNDMSLPHTNGNAVSLIERQVAILRERSIDARHKLSELLNHAKDNDLLFEKTQTLVLKLLRAKSPNDLFATVNTSFQKDFNVEFSSILFILNEPASLPSTIDCQQSDIATVKSNAEAMQHIESFLQNQLTSCGALRETEAVFLFGHSKTEPLMPQSAAIAVREIELTSTRTHGKLIVSVGHMDGNHYNQDTGTIFIDYITDILQILLQRYL